MRCVKLIKIGNRKVKVSLNFMEGEVTKRSEKDRVRIDEKFVFYSWKTKIKVANREV